MRTNNHPGPSNIDLSETDTVSSGSQDTVVALVSSNDLGKDLLEGLASRSRSPDNDACPRTVLGSLDSHHEKAHM